MSDILIQAENISKKYRLGVLNANSLKEDLILWWQRKRRRQATVDADGDSYFWALKDIDFEIRQGDVVGLIGKNGAGKSTLLKIISRIAVPTTGVVRGKGRVASLLEVGTGFHPELSGRENIFLNGNILGMKRRDIEARFDEIVDFSGVGMFLDTPVKRYSSGMYVRLAFSIAIHLNPDLLILDEVLAVGDYDFQQKCLAKIDDISKNQGQTILFVSHNMQSVKSLCNTALYLEKGRLIAQGDATSVVSNYLLRGNTYVYKQVFEDERNAPGNDAIRVGDVEIQANNKPVYGAIDKQADLSLTFSFWNRISETELLSVKLIVLNFLGECIFTMYADDIACRRGLVHGACHIPKAFLNEGSYVIHLAFFQGRRKLLFEFNQCLSFEIKSTLKSLNPDGKWRSPIQPNFPFTLTQIA